MKEYSYIGVAEDLVESYIEMYKTIDEDNENIKRINELKNLIETENKKKAKLLTYNVNGDISDKEYLEMNNECKKNIKEYTTKKENMNL